MGDSETIRLFALFTEFLKSQGHVQGTCDLNSTTPPIATDNCRSPSDVSCSSAPSSESPWSTSETHSSPFVSSPPVTMHVGRAERPESLASLQKFRAEELLRKKSLRGKPDAPQRLFHSTLKDCAMAAHIWTKAPKLDCIPSRKREAFFDKLFEELPQLKSHKTEVWKRLGQHLQNRRKYILDKSQGKRQSVKKLPTPKRGKSILLQKSSSYKSPGHKTCTKQGKKSTPTAKSPRYTSPRCKTTPGRTSTATAKSTPRLRHISPKQRSLTSVSKSKAVEDPVRNCTNDQKKQTSKSSSCKVVRPLFQDESPVFPNGSQVYIKSKDDITLGKGIVVSALNSGVFVEVCLLSKVPNIDLSDIELYEESAGSASFADLKIHQKFLWRKQRLQLLIEGSQKNRNRKDSRDKKTCTSSDKKNNIDKGPACAKKSGKTSTPPSSDDLKLVLMEWTAGEVYIGILLLEANKVLSCKKPVIQITDVTGSAFHLLCATDDKMDNAMITINPRDMQEDPDIDFLVWEPPPNLYKITGKKAYNISINDHHTFISDMKIAVSRYLA